MPPLFFSYLSYVDYNYLIDPFHSHCYLSLTPYVSLSILLYVLTQVTLKEQVQDKYDWHRQLIVIVHMCPAPAMPIWQYTTPRGKREFRDEGDEGQKLRGLRSLSGRSPN